MIKDPLRAGFAGVWLALQLLGVDEQFVGRVDGQRARDRRRRGRYLARQILLDEDPATAIRQQRHARAAGGEGGKDIEEQEWIRA